MVQWQWLSTEPLDSMRGREFGSGNYTHQDCSMQLIQITDFNFVSSFCTWVMVAYNLMEQLLKLMVLSINATVCIGIQNFECNWRMSNYFTGDNSMVQYAFQRDVYTVFLWSNCHRYCLLNNAGAHHTLTQHFVFWRRLLFSTWWCTSALLHQ
jgi:hypothetical protein